MGFWKFWEPTEKDRIRHEKTEQAIKDLREIGTLNEYLKEFLEMTFAQGLDGRINSLIEAFDNTLRDMQSQIDTLRKEISEKK